MQLCIHGYCEKVVNLLLTSSSLQSTDIHSLVSADSEKSANMSSKDLMNITNSERKIQLLRIAHVYQKHPNLQKWAKFAKDFGFVEAHRQGPNVYFRGYGKDPYCIVASQSKTGKREYNGTAFLAKTQEDFEKAKRMPGAYVTDISKAPGGGMMVSIPTPTNNLIHVVWGQTDRAEPRSPPSSQKLTYNDMNTSLDKARKGMSVAAVYVALS